MTTDQSQLEKKARPQSTMALDFAATLDNLFRIDDNLDALSRSVEQKFVIPFPVCIAAVQH
jgi:hypothetical protein